MARRTGTPVPTGIIERLKATTKSFWSSYDEPTEGGQFGSNFMPPGTPPPVVVEVDPRYLDYEAYKNYNSQADPGREGVTIPQLRALADACEVLRGVIENRKNQIYTLKIGFKLKQPKSGTPDQVKAETDNSPSIKKCREFFKKPDGQRSFRTWMRMILEELLVTDYLCIYKQQFQSGRMEARLIDSSTIVKMINKWGDSPKAPTIAFQQKLKGMVTADLTTDQMLVYHRNPRVYRHYGFSPVEMIIQIVNIALRRSNFQLSYYTEGNIPDMLLRVTATWSDEQIARYQKYFDLLMTGNLGARRRIRFIPEAMEPIYPQSDVLKDEFDEWLARVICYVFSVSPNTFIKNLNRATGEQQREQSDEEGMFAWMETGKEIIDCMIEEWLGLDDVECVWIQNKTQDSFKQAQIDEIDVKNGIRSRDEVRAIRGLPPIGIGPTVTTSHGVVSLVEGEKDHIEETKTAIDETMTKNDGTSTDKKPVASSDTSA